MNIAGLDIGTTGCKLAVYDGQAVLLSTYYTEYPATHRGGEHEIDFNAVGRGCWSCCSARPVSTGWTPSA